MMMTLMMMFPILSTLLILARGNFLADDDDDLLFCLCYVVGIVGKGVFASGNRFFRLNFPNFLDELTEFC